MNCIHKFTTKKPYSSEVQCAACQEIWPNALTHEMESILITKPSATCTHDTLVQRGQVVQCFTCDEQFVNMAYANDSQVQRKAERQARHDALNELRLTCEHEKLQLVGLELQCKQCLMLFNDTNELSTSRNAAIERKKPPVDTSIDELMRKLKVLAIQLKAQGLI